MLKTLFLNPNSSGEITDLFRCLIAARIAPDAAYEVAMLDGAPRVIASEADNAYACALLLERAAGWLGRYERIVLMSSLDTGFDALQDRTGLEVRGFTRSVLSWHKSRGRSVHAVTFDASMTPLYEHLFTSGTHAGVVQGVSTLPISPADVAGSRDHVLAALRAMCCKLKQTSAAPLFIVGAVGLQFSEILRHEEGMCIIDPIADMLAQLRVRAMGAR